MSTTTELNSIRVGARVLLLDPHDRVLLIHARDPDDPEHHWWELPGGGLDPDETPAQAATRELAEEVGIHLDHIGPCLWIRETRFRYRNQDHHRREHVFLARPTTTRPTTRPAPTDNEKLGLIERRWWTPDELDRCADKLLPPTLPTLLRNTLTGHIPTEPAMLIECGCPAVDQPPDVASARHPRGRLPRKLQR
jgi:8-oxo-dGTP pyrophosphatase MutT (NUDIX family)